MARIIIREVQAKSILSDSKVFDYVVNPYTGCQHGCSYCYARYMKRFTRHREPWGEFVDAKINAPDLLRSEIRKKKRGKVWVSGMCDPYQPLETKYTLTRKCLEILAQNNWPVVIQTRSPLVLRDIDIIKQGRDFEVGLSITTSDEEIRRIFEPKAPRMPDRVKTLEELHQAGIRTFAMIAPILPGAEDLPRLLEGKADYVLVDRMNYHHADWLYQKHGLNDKRTDDYFNRTARELSVTFEKMGINCSIVF